MKITTKYEVGHIFCVPRSYKKVYREEAMFDGEIWSRETYKLEPIVKYKEIVKIVVTVDVKMSPWISYYVVDEGRSAEMSSVYAEHQITDYTEEEALAIATTYVNKNQEYFGN
jgi:hypothetical protein